MSTPAEPNSADRELAPTANDVIETLLGHVDSEKHEQALKLLWQYRDAHRSSAVAEAVAEMEVELEECKHQNGISDREIKLESERDSLKQAVAGLEAKITQLEILIGREKAEVEFHRKDAAPRLKKVLNHFHQHMEEIIAIESSHRDTPDNSTLSTARNALKYEHL